MTTPAPALSSDRSPVPGTASPPRRRGVKSVLKGLLGTLLFGGMLAAALIWTAPNLASDWQVRNAARPVAGAGVTGGRCSSKIVFHICDATLAVPTKTGRVSRAVNYVFTDFHLGDYSVTVMADPARPELATTDLALSMLWNRAITLAVASALLAAMTVGSLLLLIRGEAVPPRAG